VTVPDNAVLVGLSGSRGWIGRLIRFFQGGDINHAFILRRDPVTGWMNLGADPGGWLSTPAEKARENKVVRLYLPPPGVDLNVGLAKLRYLLGEKYDVGGLVGMAWVLLLRKFGKKVANPLQSKRAVFCSEIVDMVLDRSGCDLGLKDGAVDPRQLEEAILKHGGFSGPYTLDDVIGPVLKAA
jgi:hypothetical protein